MNDESSRHTVGQGHFSGAEKVQRMHDLSRINGQIHDDTIVFARFLRVGAGEIDNKIDCVFPDDVVGRNKHNKPGTRTTLKQHWIARALSRVLPKLGSSLLPKPRRACTGLTAIPAFKATPRTSLDCLWNGEKSEPNVSLR